METVVFDIDNMKEKAITALSVFQKSMYGFCSKDNENILNDDNSTFKVVILTLNNDFPHMKKYYIETPDVLSNYVVFIDGELLLRKIDGENKSAKWFDCRLSISLDNVNLVNVHISGEGFESIESFDFSIDYGNPNYPTNPTNIVFSKSFEEIYKDFSDAVIRVFKNPLVTENEV